jgi:predicted TIM-barrel fold metal-dependent hydrolase
MHERNGHHLAVVDADSHVVEPPGAWDAFVTHAFRERVPRLVSKAGGDWLELEDAPFFSYGMVSGLARNDPGLPDAAGPPGGRWQDDLVAGAYDVRARLTDMDRDGIDAAVVYPTVSMGLFALRDRTLARELANAYNRWIASFVAECPDRLKGVGVLIPDEPTNAVADMTACLELGLVEVLVPSSCGGRDYADPCWEPIWAQANDTGMAIGSHAFTGRSEDRGVRSDTLVEALVDRTAAIERALVALVFGGVFDRFEGLRFVSVENEAGWAASLLDRADVSFRRGRRSSHELRGCDRLPSELFAEHVYLTFIHDQTAVDARRVIGPANLLWSTDYPHNSTTWPTSLELLDRLVRPEFGTDDLAALVGRNAAALYRIELPPSPPTVSPEETEPSRA